jgi:hypothetical protein
MCNIIIVIIMVIDIPESEPVIATKQKLSNKKDKTQVSKE